MSSVQDAGALFVGAYAFNQDISSWNLSSAYTTSYMFQQAGSFNQDLCEWGTRPFPYFGTHDIFTATGCPNQGDPVDASGPFCHMCTEV